MTADRVRSWRRGAITIIAVLAIYLDEMLTPRQHYIDFPGSALMMLGVGAVMLVVVQAQSLAAPVMAAPPPRPKKPRSQMGVSQRRSGPYRS